MNKEITFTNWVRIGDQRVALNDLPKDQQQRIADSLIYSGQFDLQAADNDCGCKCGKDRLRAARVDKHRR